MAMENFITGWVSACARHLSIFLTTGPAGLLYFWKVNGNLNMKLCSHRQLNRSSVAAGFLKVSNNKIINQYVSLSQRADSMKLNHIWDPYFHPRSQFLILQ